MVRMLIQSSKQAEVGLGKSCENDRLLLVGDVHSAALEVLTAMVRDKVGGSGKTHNQLHRLN